MPTRTGQACKYDPLLRRLQALAPEQQTVTLHVDEIAAIIHRPLPMGARTSRHWQQTWGRYWRTGGFAPRYDYLNKTVTFQRVAG